MSAIILLRRGFDFVCALAGLGLLGALGPWMLICAASSSIPQAQELAALRGTTTACRPVLGGVRVLLQGYENEFQLQTDSCRNSGFDLARPVHVVLNVMPADLHAYRSQTVTRCFGFEIESRPVHTVATDLSTARLDRAIEMVIGILATTVLFWLSWTIGTRRRALTQLLIGEPPVVRFDRR